MIEIDYREKRGWNNKNLLQKNQYVVSELRANFTQHVWESSPKSKAEGIENTKYKAIKSGCILLISPLFCRKKTATGQQCDDILGVKTRWIRKWESDKKGVFLGKWIIGWGKLCDKIGTCFGQKGCATNREVILYNYRKMVNDWKSVYLHSALKANGDKKVTSFVYILIFHSIRKI